MAQKDQPKNQPKEEPQGAPPAGTPSAGTPSDSSSTANVEDVLRPFQEASSRFLQANLAAQESVVRQHAQAWLDYQDRVRQVEQEAYRAVTEATRGYLNQLGQQASGGIEQMYAARAQAQLEYENEIRRIYTDAQAKLTDVARRAGDESGGGDAARQLASQQQDAYRAYLSDLQQAWADTKTLDPQTMNAVASHILSTMSAVGQAG